MDLQEQLKNLFPDHPVPEEKESAKEGVLFWIQTEPLICKYEKRKGKPVTIIEGYNGAASDFKILTGILKKKFNTGGGFKNETIIIQGNFRDKIMTYFKEVGFNVKRVGG